MKQHKKPEPLTHLYRGSPCVRSWSRYQETVKEWALCGIPDDNRFRKHNPRLDQALRATEDPSLVDCGQCVRLMHYGACKVARTACGFCEAEKEKRAT